MQKERRYHNVKFSTDVIQKAVEKMNYLCRDLEDVKISRTLSVTFENEAWEHDNESEFYADYNRNISSAHFTYSINYGEYNLRIQFLGNLSIVSVFAQNRSQIEEVHQIFSQSSDKCILPKKDEVIVQRPEPIIFLGHGRSKQWKELKDHLQEKHDYKIEAYEVGARAGHTIRDILEEMLRKSSLALIVMTAEDEDSEGRLHARENVIHELGLFQGKLGFHRAIAVVEEGTNEFSNLHGIQQLRYSKGRIKEIFGDVVATLKREYDK